MGSKSKTLALWLTILFLSSLVTLQSVTAKTTLLNTNGFYPLPDDNATVILLRGASYDDSSSYYPAHNTSDGYIPSSWLFALFSTGDGTTGLTISAHDCNVTITSYNYYLRNTEGYFFEVNTYLNYTVAGTGTQLIDYLNLYNHNNSNPVVYIDGIVRQQGEGWNWTNFGITITGASSTVSIHQTDMTFLPPRNAPHLELWDYILYVIPFVAVIALVTVILLLYRRHRKTTKLNH